ncbi:MAG TPA: histidine phosphatase family protein [Bacillota bacterium]|nr:histidine phosphatase family protein [Bacillota bacterium]
MLSLYFVRHGQTEWNEQKRIQGRKDSPLTKKGLRDAEYLGNHLKDIEWTAMYSSPSKRTQLTAKMIKGEQSGTIKIDENLYEMHLGESEGRTMEEIKQKNPTFYLNYWDRPSAFYNDTGETFFDVKKRVEAFIEMVQQTYQSGNILIVTHGIVIKVAQLIINDWPMDQLWETPFIDVSSVTKVNIVDSTFETSFAGDLSHLPLT